MLNEESLEPMEPLCYLILLMNSLGIEVNSIKISDLWTGALQQKALPAELIELMVFFWKRSGRQRDFSALSHPLSRCAKTEESVKPSQVPDGNEGLPEKAPEVAPQREVKENAVIKEAPIQKTTSQPEKTTEEPPGKPVESVLMETAGELLPDDNALSGRYVYGIVLEADDFQFRGINDNPVYMIPYRDIGALVHACPSHAYESTDREQVEKWLREHQNVLDKAFKHTSSLVPMTFDMIIDGSSAANPDTVLEQWLQDRYEAIRKLLSQLSGRAEYGVKIYCSLEMLTEKVSKERPEIIELTNKIASMNKGTAYLFKSELAQKIRKAVEDESKTLAKEICLKIRPLISDLKENKLDTEVSNNQKPILNIAILADPERVETVGNLLENLQMSGQYTIVFTGPWPAYSFVKDLE